MHDALRRDTAGKQNQVTDLLDEIERKQKIFTKLAKMMVDYEVPVNIGLVIIDEAGR